MADLEYHVHWSCHHDLLAGIRQATGAEALIGASAVTYNPHLRPVSLHLSATKVLVHCSNGQMYQSC